MDLFYEQHFKTMGYFSFVKTWKMLCQKCSQNDAFLEKKKNENRNRGKKTRARSITLIRIHIDSGWTNTKWGEQCLTPGGLGVAHEETPLGSVPLFSCLINSCAELSARMILESKLSCFAKSKNFSFLQGEKMYTDPTLLFFLKNLYIVIQRQLCFQADFGFSSSFA